MPGRVVRAATDLRPFPHHGHHYKTAYQTACEDPESPEYVEINERFKPKENQKYAKPSTSTEEFFDYNQHALDLGDVIIYSSDEEVDNKPSPIIQRDKTNGIKFFEDLKPTTKKVREYLDVICPTMPLLILVKDPSASTSFQRKGKFIPGKPTKVKRANHQVPPVQQDIHDDSFMILTSSSDSSCSENDEPHTKITDMNKAKTQASSDSDSSDDNLPITAFVKAKGTKLPAKKTNSSTCRVKEKAKTTTKTKQTSNEPDLAWASFTGSQEGSITVTQRARMGTPFGSEFNPVVPNPMPQPTVREEFSKVGRCGRNANTRGKVQRGKAVTLKRPRSPPSEVSNHFAKDRPMNTSSPTSSTCSSTGSCASRGRPKKQSNLTFDDLDIFSNSTTFVSQDESDTETNNDIKCKRKRGRPKKARVSSTKTSKITARKGQCGHQNSSKDTVPSPTTSSSSASSRGRGRPKKRATFNSDAVVVLSVTNESTTESDTSFDTIPVMNEENVNYKNSSLPSHSNSQRGKISRGCPPKSTSCSSITSNTSTTSTIVKGRGRPRKKSTFTLEDVTLLSDPMNSNTDSESVVASPVIVRSINISNNNSSPTYSTSPKPKRGRGRPRKQTSSSSVSSKSTTTSASINSRGRPRRTKQMKFNKHPVLMNSTSPLLDEPSNFSNATLSMQSSSNSTQIENNQSHNNTNSQFTAEIDSPVLTQSSQESALPSTQSSGETFSTRLQDGRRPANRSADTNRDTVERNRRRANRREAQPPVIPLLIRDEFEPHDNYRSYVVDYEPNMPRHLDLGNFTSKCAYCGAYFFEKEAAPDARGYYKLCCNYGKVPPLVRERPLPELFVDLYIGETEQAKEYRRRMRLYNNNFAMVSMSANVLPHPGRAPYLYKIQGQVCHTACGTQVPLGCTPRNNQLYHLDIDQALDLRLQTGAAFLKLPLLNTLERLLRDCNPFVQAYEFMGEILRQEEAEAEREGRHRRRVALVFPRENDQQEHQAEDQQPVRRNRVAAVYLGDDCPYKVHLMCCHDRRKKTLHVTSPITMPLMYPLLFPLGERGWTFGMRHDPANATAQRNNVTMREFGASLLMVRDGFEPIHHGRDLTQQFVTTFGALCDSKDVTFIRKNQKRLFTESRQALEETMVRRHARADETETTTVGRAFVLPSCFQNSPRQKRKDFLDETAVARAIGHANLFLTVTANPKWPEMNRFPEEIGKQGHHHLLVRVFRAKMTILLNRIVKEGIFGHVIHYTAVIEWQKMGNVHMHAIFTLAEEDKFTQAEDIDKIIWARLPDYDTQRNLYDLTAKFQLHGKCKNNELLKCWNPKTKKCDMHFPCRCRTDTEYVQIIGKWFYARPVECTPFVKGGIVYTNEDVVPYCPLLLEDLECHHNLEIVTLGILIKYLYKYLVKLPEGTRLEVLEYDEATGVRTITRDELKAYLEVAILQPSEAAWRIYKYPMRETMHTVILLAIHLPGQESIFFEDGEEEPALERQRHRLSTLTAFFALCNGDNDDSVLARTLLYEEVPRGFVWQQKEKNWKRRERNHRTIGRLIDVSPIRKELFALKLLLLHVRGPTSFEMLRTVDGEEHRTFVEACSALRLLRGDRDLQTCLATAASFKRPRQMRRLFGYLMVYNNVTDAQVMFDLQRRELTLNYVRAGLSEEESIARAKRSIAGTVLRAGGQIEDFRDFFEGVDVDFTAEHLRELGQERQQAEEAEPPQPAGQLNTEQQQVFDEVCLAVENFAEGNRTDSKCFLMEGAAGTGKTYVYNKIIENLKSQGKTCVVVAWSGIAASLLEGGVTCHNAFRLPADLNEESVSLMDPVKNQHQWLNLLRCSLIIWDEVSMAPKHAMKILHDLLCRIHQNDTLMGGVPLLLGGDFRQVLPVPDEKCSAMNLSIKFYEELHHFKHFTLKVNLRAAPDQREFANWLEQLGNGKHAVVQGQPPNAVQVPPACVVQSVQEMIEVVYEGDALNNYQRRAILTPLNKDVHQINDIILASIPAEEHVLLAENVDPDPPTGNIEADHVTMEMMQQSNHPGFPLHELKLKHGCLVMLLRNMDVPHGLCNGTRLVVTNISRDLLVCRIVGGKFDNDDAFIPRMELQITKGKKKSFTRIQFPVRVSYAMTINKSQGQSLERVGIHLPDPVFSHGMLYVAFSRASRLQDIHVHVKETRHQGVRGGKTITVNKVIPNIVYQVPPAAQ